MPESLISRGSWAGRLTINRVLQLSNCRTSARSHQESPCGLGPLGNRAAVLKTAASRRLSFVEGLFYFSKETSSNVSNHRGIIDIGLFFDFLRDFGNVSRKIFYSIRLRLRELRDVEVGTSQAT